MPCAARPRRPGVDVFQKDWWREGRTKKLRTVWLSPEVGSSDEAVAEVKALLGGSVLASPKPTGSSGASCRWIPLVAEPLRDATAYQMVCRGHEESSATPAR